MSVINNKSHVSSTKKESKDNKITHYKSRGIFYSITFLAFFGCIMITSATMGIAAGSYSTLITTILKQIVFVAGGFILMYLSNRNFKLSLLKNNGFMLALLGALFVGLILPLAFPSVYGAKAWIRLGPLGTIQPSEFAKVGLILVIAAYLGDQGHVSFEKYKQAYNVAIGTVIVSCFIVTILQSDFGSAVVMAGISFVCFLVPQSKRIAHIQKLAKRIFVFGVALVIIILILPIGETIVDNVLVFLKDYQKARIFSARDPFVDQYDTGYQLINGLVAFASGGFGGVGFGNSVRKFTNFPAANTDYILSIVVEEMGFFGYLLVLIPYVMILSLLFYYAFKMRSEKGRIILVGVASYLLIHFLFNVGGETGLIPLTGVPLLMMSQGGSSAASTMLAIGVAQAVISSYRKGEIS